MKQAVIDIGSNSVRLTLYELDGTEFKILFREKIMAGLAGYVDENGNLSPIGIECACSGLKIFFDILKSLHIDNTAVFATASLRNINNTNEAVSQIKAACGYDIEILSENDEALCGYYGAMREFELPDGAFIDVGGGSTEVVTFENAKVIDCISFPIGSLSLYSSCVKKILPGKGSIERILGEIKKQTDGCEIFSSYAKRKVLTGVGGTARGLLKIAKSCFELPESCRCISAYQLGKLTDFLCSGSKKASDLILKLEPDRIHTIVPGVMILHHIFRLLGADELIVSKYGVREGYLCTKLYPSAKENTTALKTVN